MVQSAQNWLVIVFKFIKPDAFDVFEWINIRWDKGDRTHQGEADEEENPEGVLN